MFPSNARKRGFSISFVPLDILKVIKEVNRAEDWNLKTSILDVKELVSPSAKISFMNIPRTFNGAPHLAANMDNHM